jgi:hypothetical protein
MRKRTCNFLLTAEIDGEGERIQISPKTADGGIYAEIFLRNQGVYAAEPIKIRGIGACQDDQTSLEIRIPKRFVTELEIEGNEIFVMMDMHR